MPTNPLGQGTSNVPVNLLDAEKAILGRLALEDDRSLGDFIRRSVITGLRVNNPKAARELEDARQAHYERQSGQCVNCKPKEKCRRHTGFKGVSK